MMIKASGVWIFLVSVPWKLKEVGWSSRWLHLFSMSTLGPYTKHFSSSSESGVSDSPPNGKRPSPSPTKPSDSGEGNTNTHAHLTSYFLSLAGVCHWLCPHMYPHRVHCHVHLWEQWTGRPELPAGRCCHGDQERRGLVDGHGQRQDWSLPFQLC